MQLKQINYMMYIGLQGLQCVQVVTAVASAISDAVADAAVDAAGAVADVMRWRQYRTDALTCMYFRHI